jgi:hypothetical protein
MPPRYSYWTIIADGLPTAFRAAERDELLPTFTRIKSKHPDAQMKWFARGRLWDSPDSARREASAKREADARRAQKPGRDWRPGGSHRDPRQPFRDAKKARNAAHRKRKFERREKWGVARPPGEPGHRPPRDRRAPRSFEQRQFSRNQQRNEPPTAPPPDETRREPRPREGTEPTPPPRPSEPVIPPPGPPERGRRRRPPDRRKR